MRTLLLFVLLLAACPGGHCRGDRAAADVKQRATPDEDPVARSMAFYDGREYFERPIARAGTVENLPNVRAETCGACHQAIYEEWKLSTHRRAWLDDAQFMAELEKSRGEHDPAHGDVGWMCVNCHTPMIEQLEQLVVGLEDGQINQPEYVDNPTFDEAFQEEAISCATCHVRDGVVLGPYGGDAAPHPVEKSDELQTVDPCVRCHQAEQFYTSQNLGCFFTTGREWEHSPSGRAGETCQSCHMPTVQRKIAEAFDVPVRTSRRHWFGGSLIPKKPEYAEEIAQLEEVYGDGVSIEVVPVSDSLLAALDEQPAMAAPDQKVADERLIEATGTQYAVAVANDRAGHRVPTGDPERHVDVEVTVKDEAGEVVARAWTRYGSRYEWWPKTRLLADTRIEPGTTRYILFHIPPDAATVEVVAFKYRMYQDAFDYHELSGEYVRGREFFGEEWRVNDGELQPQPH